MQRVRQGPQPKSLCPERTWSSGGSLPPLGSEAMAHVKRLSANYTALGGWKGLSWLSFLHHIWSPEHQAGEPRMGARETRPMGILEEELVSQARWGHLACRDSILLVGDALEFHEAAWPRGEPSPKSSYCPQDRQPLTGRCIQ